MKTSIRCALGFYIGALSFLLTYSLIWIWPSKDPYQAVLSSEAQYLLMAALAGALGSYIHLATSFIEYAGREALGVSWMWWYLLRPWIGSALAVVVYFVVRAGLITGASEGSTAAINPYGIASIAAMSGMFSKQATDKLREVFENVCATEKQESKDDKA